MLDTEFKYYVEHQKELVEKFQGKFLVIVGNEVVGAYETLEDAVIESGKKYQPGTFLVQECHPGEENYTLTFHSRAVFA